MPWQDESDDVLVTEPILAKKDCKVRIDSVEKTSWTVKEGVPGYSGKSYAALKGTATIIDEQVQTEHEGARPRLSLDFQFNLEKYPFVDRKTGEIRFMGKGSLYELQEALGFDPVFQDAQGQPVAPYVTKAGRKVAPKGEGIKQVINPDFLTAYFTPEGEPKLEFAEQVVYADIGVERSEQYGDKNVIKRFKRAPAR